ncbi:helix-turn-helix domain-containing protein [Streptomyces sp. PSKA28]|uniref:Helix-turn-helix domain-containing protein n=1 Tax=Streptomyces himalayensis subsp. himalayensis TaxID=2756131 RepID=A0A7W0DMS3_9ACTN|nr:helix-turn-helix domain-containing protein [Streptomyces himalayensis subsp. himalayensis]
MRTRRLVREGNGRLSQEQIAKALNTWRESVGHWETGRSEPRPQKRASYARLLDGLSACCPAEAALPRCVKVLLQH